MKAYLSLGTNLGDREEFLNQARNFLHDPPRTNLVRSSEILNTEAMDFISQPDFLNQVLEIETSLTPIELLDFTQSIEKKWDGSKDLIKALEKLTSIYYYTKVLIRWMRRG